MSGLESVSDLSADSVAAALRAHFGDPGLEVTRFNRPLDLENGNDYHNSGVARFEVGVASEDGEEREWKILAKEALT